MFLRRVFSVLTLGVSLAGWQAVRAEEPTDPIPQAARERYAEAQDLDRQGKVREAIAAYEDAVRLGMQASPRVRLKEANAYLRLRDYEGAAAQYTRFIEDFGLEGSCRD